MVELFDGAMNDVGITERPLRGTLHDYFAWSTDRMGLHPDSPTPSPMTPRAPHRDVDGPVSG